MDFLSEKAEAAAQLCDEIMKDKSLSFKVRAAAAMMILDCVCFSEEELNLFEEESITNA